MARGRGLAGARRRLDDLDVDPAAVDGDASDVSVPGPDDEFYVPRPGTVGTVGVAKNDGAVDGDRGLDDYDGEGDEPEEAAPRGDRLRRVLVASLAALLVLAVGFGVGVRVGSPKYPGDDSADAGFARDMMIHHAQAVSMASLEYRATGSAALKTLAVDITLTQQAQIGIMSAWLDTWGLSPTSSKGRMSWIPDGGKSLLVDGRMPGMATDAQLAKLQSDTGKARDILFCQLMISHHLGGIHMVDAVLPLSHNSQVTKLAEQIKASQQSEILALQQIEDALNTTK